MNRVVDRSQLLHNLPLTTDELTFFRSVAVDGDPPGAWHAVRHQESTILPASSRYGPLVQFAVFSSFALLEHRFEFFFE
jgi:hypothetical protein